MKVMCFAMREGIVHQQLDVCGDVETNVNERRTTTAAPPTPFRSSTSLFPRKPTSISLPSPLPNLSTPTSSISLSYFLSLTSASCCLFEFAATLIYTRTQIFYIVLYVPADVCMHSMCCIYYWYSP